MDKKGLTLLELILAMTILSVILLAAGTMNVSAMRLSAITAEDIQLHNEMQYVFRDMEKYIRSAQSATTTNVTSCPGGAQCLQVTRVTVDEVTRAEINVVTNYVYNPAAKSLARDGITLSQGITQMSKPNPSGEPQNLPVFVISSSDKGYLVDINLAAQTVRNGKTVTLPGITKSILLRGGNP